MVNKAPLPVPNQLKAQLEKCKSVRDEEFCKSREKTPQVCCRQYIDPSSSRNANREVRGSVWRTDLVEERILNELNPLKPLPSRHSGRDD